LISRSATGGLELVNLRQSIVQLRQKHPTGAIHGKAQFDPSRSRPRLEVIAGDRNWQGKHIERVQVVLASGCTAAGREWPTRQGTTCRRRLEKHGNVAGIPNG
jgi:hypothetical protein